MRDRDASQGFVQTSGQPFLAQSSELGDVAAGTLLVGVRNQPTEAATGLVYHFRGTGQYGAWERFFSVAGAQVVQLDIAAFSNWSLQLVAAAGLILPPTDPPLAWAATLPKRPDPARRDRARLAVTYAAGVVAPVPPGALRCWSASGSSVSVNWSTCDLSSTMMVIADTLAPGVEAAPKGTNLQPTTPLDLIWEIEL